MEFVGVLYSVGLVLFGSMLRKGESMKELAYYRNGIRHSFRLVDVDRSESRSGPFCLDICKHYEKPEEDQRPVECRYEPAKSTVSSSNRRKYLKLYNGDIYCVESNTILDRHTLSELMKQL